MYKRQEQLLTKGMPGRHTRFKQTDLGEIPEDWEVLPVGQVTESVVPGRTKPKVFDGTIPWLTVADLQSSIVNHSIAGLNVSEKELADCGGKIVPARTVLMSCVGRFGIVAVTSTAVTMNQQLHGFICRPCLDPMFLCLSLRSAEPRMRADSGQTTVPYLNKSRCESILISLPSLQEQVEIAAAFSHWESCLQHEDSVLFNLKALKSSLSSSLLSGELRVPTDSVPCPV